ncbi:hypothetical protein NLU13_3990 [Sarocladium strictum]|uniref:Carrier domain-containing protein n=1 Tax=Sarocladium strictum TaxID=5046 RepID=A0AA39GI16_SARSR|nr:hypothetical protein NLU13_3990 [Sarocladium strictum]
MDVELGHVRSVIDLIQHHAKIRPNSPCVCKGDRSLTYEELDKASEAVARLLVAKGVVPGDAVPLVTSRCLEMVVCVLAIVRTRAIWVPMEIDTWGLDRIQTVSASLGQKVALITDMEPRGLQGAICLDQIQRAVATRSSFDKSGTGQAVVESTTEAWGLAQPTDSSGLARSQDVAYIIFTSGTTGVPKGIMIKHESLLNYVWPGHGDSSMPFNLGVQPGDKVLLLFSVAFDAYYGVLFSTLCNGGQLLLSEPSTLVDDVKLCNVLPVTPTLLGAMDPSGSTHLRAVFLGGESPSPELIKRWSCPGRRLYNAYGPTEATISVTMAELTPDLPVTLGSPIRNSHVFLLGEDMRESSVGELCIGGSTVLALGYYRDDDRTQASFVQWQGQRIYRTGDMAKRTEHGLVFLGRKDLIVKNRGFLINIEAEVVPSLLSYPGVVSATAAMHRGRLVAFIAPKVVGDGLEIRKALAGTQDQFLVPDAVVVMDQLPRTGNGKIDTKALIQGLSHAATIEDGVGRELASSSTATNSESFVLFKKALGGALQLPATSIDIDRSFVELGGNSLVALKLVSLLRQQGLNVSMPSLYSSPSLSALLSGVVEIAESINGTGMPTADCTCTRETGGQDPNVTFQLTATQQGLIRSTMLDPPVGYMLVRISLNNTKGNTEGFPAILSRAWEAVLSKLDLFRCVFDLTETKGELGHNYRHDWETITVQQPEEIHGSVSSQSEQLSIQAQQAHSSQSGIFTPCNAFRYIHCPEESHVTSSAVLLWFVHHALVDGHSVSRILEEVQQQLATQMKDLSDEEEEEEVKAAVPSFFRYAEAVDSHVESTRDKAWDFWASALKPVLGGIELNVSRHKSSDAEAPLAPEAASSTSLTISEQVLDMGMSVSDFQGCAMAIDGMSTAVIMHAAWALLLQRYASTNNIVFGSAISARNLPLSGIDDMIGPLLNHCPIPVAVPSMSVTRNCFLRSVRDLILQVMEHQWSFPYVLEKLSSGSHAGLFSTALFLEYDLPGLQKEKVDQHTRETWSCERTDWPEFGLTMQVRNVDGQLSLRALYRPEKYSSSLIQRLIVHFKNLLVNLVFPEDRTLGDIQMGMLGDVERLRLVRNNPRYWEPYHGPQTLKEAFEKGVDQWGEQIAIESPSRTLSYRALDRITNLAGRTIVSSVGTGKVVAVWGDGSIDWLVGALSVIKSGGTYLPLDTKLPMERMASMMKTAGAVLLILPNDQNSQHTLSLEGPRLFMDEVWKSEDLSPGASPQRLPNTARPDDYAYIMFTSGTTGTPKGIRVTHRATMSHFASKETTLHARPGRRHAQVFSPGFDVSIAEAFGVLCSGATLVLKKPGDPFAHLARVHATMITPSLLSVLSVSDYPLLDSIYLIGEAVPQALADTWAEHKTLWNFYGPCECTIAALYTQLKPGDVVTIGKALPRVGVYILDEQMMPVPVGVSGEIYLSGVQVMEGYIGKGSEAATARAFLRDPFLDGQRLYRTGDLGVWTEDMNVLFQGRTDHQVKVRGYRVELDEIEHIIRRSSRSVQQSAAIVLQDRIIAFAAPEAVDLGAIEEALRQSLPSYAVPQSIIPLRTLPTTPNQKLDRKRLAEMSVERQQGPCPAILDVPVSATEAASTMETLVVNTWREVLGLSDAISISPDDDFMMIGGHSLQQIKVAQKICSALGKAVPFGVFLRATRLRPLAQAIQDFCSQMNNNTETSFLEYSNLPTQATDDVLSPMELEILKLHRKSACPSTLNVAHIITLAGNLHIDVLRQAIELVGSDHDILRTRYVTDGDEKSWRPFLSEELRVDVIRGELDDSVVSAMVNTAFDLRSDQLTRVAIVQQDEKHNAIIFVQHHVLCDQKSLQVFFRCVGEAYDELQKNGSASSNRHKTPSYRTWASWKANTLQKSPDEQKKRFWMEAFARVKNDNVRSQDWTFTDASLMTPMHLQSGAIKNVTRHCAMESFLTMVARACQTTLGMHNVLLGVPFIDRSEPGTDEILGTFLDTIPLPLNLPPGHDADLESTVQAALRDALAHALPHSQIREAVHRQRLVDIMVVFNRFEERVTRDMVITGARVINVEPRRAKGSKFPMLIEFTERGEDEMLIELEYFAEAVSPASADALMACLRSFVSCRQ